MFSSLSVALLLVILPILSFVGFVAYVLIRYAPVIARIFEARPVFFPLQVQPTTDGESVRFRTPDGLELTGTYFKCQTESRLGIVVFCHEFLGNRWSAIPYAGGLRNAGFDIFAFDFRNHGDSDVEPNYDAFQWVCDREVVDLKAALHYLRTRGDYDPAGFGLFGVSRGGGTALIVGSEETDVWGVVTDSAFSTRITMLSYILRWAEIYVGRWWIWSYMPESVFGLIGWVGRVQTEWRCRRKFPNIERAVGRIAPRPLLMIHGERDVYIGRDIAQKLFERAEEPKSIWFVPGAKHNRCRESSPEQYRLRLTEFMLQASPRSRPAPASSHSSPNGSVTPNTHLPRAKVAEQFVSSAISS